jgi:hypothetical protein
MVDRARVAAAKWIPYSPAGAAISFVAGFVFSLSAAQMIVSTAITASPIFSGLLFRS